MIPTAVYILLFATSLTNLVPSISYRGQQVSYSTFAVPGLMFASVLAAATTFGTALFQERLSAMTLELRTLPLRTGVYIASKLVAGAVLVLTQTLLALAVSALVFPVPWPTTHWLALLAGATVAALAFNSLYLLLAALIHDFQRFTVTVNVLAPFYPQGQMAPVLRWLSWANPA